MSVAAGDPVVDEREMAFDVVHFPAVLRGLDTVHLGSFCDCV